MPESESKTAPGITKLWLWKNFVDGRPEYWAFDNPYPCHDNGNPMTLGEPCGYAILKQSVNGRPDIEEADVLAAIRAAQEQPRKRPTIEELATILLESDAKVNILPDGTIHRT